MVDSSFYEKKNVVDMERRTEENSQPVEMILLEVFFCSRQGRCGVSPRFCWVWYLIPFNFLLP
jgi:hypothetical protein